MGVSAQDVKELRARTGVGMMDCKRALQEAGGDADKARQLLREKGLAKARQTRGRTDRFDMERPKCFPGYSLCRLGVTVSP